MTAYQYLAFDDDEEEEEDGHGGLKSPESTAWEGGEMVPVPQYVLDEIRTLLRDLVTNIAKECAGADGTVMLSDFRRWLLLNSQALQLLNFVLEDVKTS